MNTDAIEFILRTPKCAVFLKTGTGKTRIVLEALKRLPTGRTLVIAPKLVAETVWPEEMSAVDLSPPVVINGSPKKRLSLLEEPSFFFTIGVDLIPWLVETGEFDFDYVIIDESSKFKNPDSLRFKAICDLIQKTTRVILMSGTPVSNGLLDIWSQTYLLDGGKRLSSDFYVFRRMYFKQIAVDRRRNFYVPYSFAAKHVLDRIKDICYNEETEDSHIPPQSVYREYVSLSRRSRTDYEQMERHFVLETETDVVTAATKAVLVNKLLQICSGAIYSADGSINKVHDEKMTKLGELLRGPLRRRNVILVYNYRFEREMLMKLPGAKLMSVESIDAWNRGEIKYLLLNPKSAGHGLNLQYGGFTIVWYGLTWSLEEYMQTNARVTRRGQPMGRTEIYHLIAQRTVEEILMRKLRRKGVFQDNFLDVIRRQSEMIDELREDIIEIKRSQGGLKYGRV